MASRALRVGFPSLFALIAACSGDRVEEPLGAFREALSTTGRILSFEGGIGGAGTGLDWKAAVGTAVSTTPASHLSKAMALGANWNPSANSAPLPALGPLSGPPKIDVRFPTGYANQGSYFGQAALYITCSSANIFNHYVPPAQLLGPTGTYKTYTLGSLPANVASALSNTSGCTVKVELNLSNSGTKPVLVDRLTFGEAPEGSGGVGGGSGAGGKGGTSGTGGSTSGTAGSTAGKGGSGGSTGGSGGSTGGTGGSTGGTSGTSGMGGTSSGTSGTSGSGGTSAGTSGTGGSGGNPGQADVEYFIELPVNVARDAVALGAYGAGLSLQDNVEVRTLSTGYSSVSSVRTSTVADLGVSADVQHLWSQPDVVLRNNALVHGNLLTEGTVSLQSGAAILGARLENTELDPIQHLGWSIHFPLLNGGALDLEPGQIRTISAGAFAGGNIKTGARLTLSTPGIYTLNGSLTLEPGSTLDIDNTAGSVEIYLRNDFTFRGTLAPRDPTKANILIGVAGTTPVPIDGPWRGILVAPHAVVTLATASAGHFGAVYAKGILASPNTIFTHTPLVPPNFCTANSECNGLCTCDTGGDCDDDGDCATGIDCAPSGICGGTDGSCSTTSQCAPGLTCVGGVCRPCEENPSDPACTASHCTNGVRDQGETDVDCGGPCPGCGPGETCNLVEDCNDGLACEGGQCACTCTGKACGADNGCGVACTCPPGTPGCELDTDCEEGTICHRGTCVEPGCPKNPVAGGCGFPGAPCGEQCTRRPICNSDADCDSGYVCPPRNGWRYAVPGLRVCERPECATFTLALALGCGTPSDECGACECAPSCTGKSCGDTNLDDGCNNRCTGVCGPGETGCQLDSDCTGGFMCRGGSCRPTEPCGDPNLAPPDCGPDSLCGPCNSGTPPGPSGHECGFDALTGLELGPCPNGSFCNSAGQCAPIDETPPIVVPPGREVPPPPAPPPVGVGATDGTFSITDRGSASYSITLELPPGRSVEPSLSLRYTSSSSNGILGVGWSLDGLSAISRCPRTYAQDGRAEPVLGLPTDSLCLDGQRLVRLSDGTYRTTIDTFSKIIARDPNTAPLLSFTVLAKDGRKLTYGGTTTSRVYLQADVVGTWALSRVEDRAGNFMRIEYEALVGNDTQGNRVVTRELRPHVITYTGHGSLDGDREVIFSYMPRTDLVVGWRSDGSGFSRGSLMSQIEIRAQNQFVRKYALGYSAVHATSVLTSVTECAGNFSVCKPPTTFEYVDDGLGFREPEVAPITCLDQPGGCFGNPPPGISALGIVHKPTSFSGHDVLRAASLDSFVVPSAHYYGMAAFVAAFVPEVGPFISMALNASAVDDEHFRFTAYDLTIRPTSEGGGFANLAAPSNPCPRDLIPSQQLTASNPTFGHGEDVQAICPIERTTGRTIIVRTGQAGVVELPQVMIWSPNVWFVDINGDGVQDKVYCSFDGNDVNIAFAKYAETGIADIPLAASDADRDTWAPAWANLCRLECENEEDVHCAQRRDFSTVFDVDGDGTANLVVYDGSGQNQGWAALIFDETGPHWNSELLAGVSILANHTDAVYTIDVNGDGLRDLLALPDRDVNPNRKPRVAFNTGRLGGFKEFELFATGEAALAPRLPAVVIDFDHDGIEELLEPTSNFELMWRVRRIIGTSIVPEFLPDMLAGPGTLGDFDGDGNVDAWTRELDERGRPIGPFKLHRGRGHQNGLLKSITDGLGRRTEIDYDGKARSFFPPAPREQGSESFVRRTPVPQQALVSEHRDIHYSDNQTRTMLVLDRRVSYAYGDWFEDMAGYGALGFNFREIVERDVVGDEAKRTIVEYKASQRLPTTGVPYQRAFSGLVSKTSTVLPLANSEISKQGYTAGSETTFDWELSTSDAGLPFVFLGETTGRAGMVVTELVGDNPPVPTPVLVEHAYRTTTYAVDEYGNRTDERFTGTWVAPTGIHREFTPTAAELDAWLTGLVKSETAVSAPPGCLDPDECTSALRARFLELEYYPGTDLVHFVRREMGNPSLQRVTELIRDERGNVERAVTTDASGNVREEGVTFDERGMFPVEMQSVGEGATHITQVRYDDRFGVVVASADPNGIDETWSYDAFGLLRTHHGPDGDLAVDYGPANYYQVSQDNGQNLIPIPAALRVSAVLAGGASRETELNALGQPVRRKSFGLNGQEIFEEIAYDYRNRLSYQSRPHLEADETQGFTTYLYDALNRLVVQQLANGGAIQYQHALSQFLSPAFPGIGGGFSVTRVIDSNGHATARGVDDMGRAKVIVSALGPPSTDYMYGAFNELVAINMGEAGRVRLTKDAYGRVVSFYDPQRGLEPETHAYNGLDELVASTDAAGRTQNLFYDDFGRLERIEDPDGASQWIYDGDGSEPNTIGRLVETESPTGQRVKYGFEPGENASNRGLLTSVVHSLTAPGSGGETHAFATNMSYDSFSRLERVDYPEVAGERLSVRYSFDSFGHTLKAANDSDSTEVYWELLEAHQGFRVARERLGSAACGSASGTVTERLYDALTGLPTSIATRCNQNVLQHLAYDHDLAGNLTQRKDLVRGSTEDFGYDALNRLETVNNEVVYRYDSNFGHNGLSFQAGVGDYLPQSGMNPNLYWTGSAGENQYLHDAVGNTRERSGPSVTGSAQTLDYTTFNLPSRVTTANGPTVDFAYDADGSRVAKRSGTDATTFYPGDLQRLTERTGQPAEGLNVIYAGGRAVAIAAREDTSGSARTLRYLHDDILGSIQTITAADGSVETTRDYGPFGAQRGTNRMMDEVPLGFTGHEEDPDLGLINMRGRIYDPVLGQFLTADPIVQNPAGPGLNRFAYVGNSPLNFTDPSGFLVASTFETAGGYGYTFYPDVVNGYVGTGGVPGSAAGPVGTEATALSGPGGSALGGLGTAVAAGTSLVTMVNAGSGPTHHTPVAQGRGNVASTSSVPPPARASTTPWAPDAEPPPPAGNPEWGRAPDLSHTQGPHDATALGNELLSNPSFQVTDTSESLELEFLVLTSIPDAAMLAAGVGKWLATRGFQAAARAAPAVTRGTSVLGHHPGYLEKAAELGARRFNIPTGVWNKMSAAERWGANQKFLDRLIARGDQVVLSTPARLAAPGSSFARELAYLQSRGYTLNAEGTLLLPP